MQAHNAEENGSQDVDVLSIQVVPDLAIAIEYASTIDIHIISAKLEECCCILKDLLEGVGLPVVGIIRELDVTLDLDIDMIEGKVKCCPDHVFLASRKDDMATVVATVDSREDIVRIVRHAVVVRIDKTDFVPGRRGGKGFIRLLWRDVDSRTSSLVFGIGDREGIGVFLLCRP